MNRRSLILLLYSLVLAAWIPESGAAVGFTPCTIVTGPGASAVEHFAAREVRRYVYLRTGRLLEVTDATGAPSGDLIIVAQRSRVDLTGPDASAELVAKFDALQPEQYLIKTFSSSGGRTVMLCGGDPVGTLYAAYRFAELLGVRFYLHGDVIPDKRLSSWRPAGFDDEGKPLFALRGIQPFHDFPEGPDWWNRDDYLAILSQLPKLRMNFFGLHTYPEGGPNAEPTVWIGLPEDADRQGNVRFSYPASYQNTLRGNWGYSARKTGAWFFGAANLFERDDFGGDVMLGHIPNPKTPEAANEVFNRTGLLLREAFAHARKLGVKTCVGTETPLTIPKQVKGRLESAGKNPADIVAAQELYEGIFQRATRAYAPDYYWFWTPEGWTWEGTKDAQVRATIDDLFAAIAAAKRINSPIKLATCGWVLGPQQDRALFDKVLPKDIAVSCINREVGKTPVDKGFAEVSGRGKWAIPWMEDDPALTSPQLWAGRMRRDAADALAYGCDGLMGIHWRTRILGPAVAALAQASWTQASWNPQPGRPFASPREEGPDGGSVAAFPSNAIADTEDATIYQTVRYNLSAYRVAAPNGSYKLTLKFCEPHYNEAGKRVFDVKVQGKPVLTKLDIFARAGKNRALDYVYDGVQVTNGWLDVEFNPVAEFPSIAAIVVEGDSYSRKINCGGPAYKDFIADTRENGRQPGTFPLIDDFYQDWARQEFGPEVADKTAAVFTKVDGQLPRTSDWIDGPGGIRPDSRPWSTVRDEYTFVLELEGLQSKVKGDGNRERFDWWLDTFRYMRTMAQLNCVWAQYTNAIGQVKAQSDPVQRKQLAMATAIPLRKDLVTLAGEVYRLLLSTVSNPGELGTVANWEQHLMPGLLIKPGEELEKILGESLPLTAKPDQDYHGPTRVIVPTVRTTVGPGEEMVLKVIVLSGAPPRDATLHWREMGQGMFRKIDLTPVARGVYRVQLPPNALDVDLEYYVRVKPAEGGTVYFPATAPSLNQTLVSMR